MQLLTMYLGNKGLKLIIIDKHVILLKNAFIQGKSEKLGQEVIYSSKYFNSKYMEFVDYDTCDKLIWTSGEVSIITNKMSKQGIAKTNIKKVSTTSTLSFGCYPHKETCDILSEDLF